MSGVVLPIDIVPNSDPPIFRWSQTVESMTGERVVVEYQGALPPNVEEAVKRLIKITRRLMAVVTAPPREDAVVARSGTAVARPPPGGKKNQGR